MTDPTQFAEGFLRLKALLAEVGDAQWRAGITHVAREDTTERSKGIVSDPTPSIVADQRRLELREACRQADESLEQAGYALTTAVRNLERALNRWQGETDA